MRVILRSVSNETHDWYVFCSKIRGKATEIIPPEVAPAKSRVFQEEKIQQLKVDKILLERTSKLDANDVYVAFARLDIHGLLGGSKDGFLKMFKQRHHVEFLHFSELEQHPTFWEEQFQWLRVQLNAERVIVSPKERQIKLKSKSQVERLVGDALTTNSPSTTTTTTTATPTTPKNPTTTQQLLSANPNPTQNQSVLAPLSLSTSTPPKSSATPPLFSAITTTTTSNIKTEQNLLPPLITSQLLSQIDEELPTKKPKIDQQTGSFNLQVPLSVPSSNTSQNTNNNNNGLSATVSPKALNPTNTTNTTNQKSNSTNTNKLPIPTSLLPNIQIQN